MPFTGASLHTCNPLIRVNGYIQRLHEGCRERASARAHHDIMTVALCLCVLTSATLVKRSSPHVSPNFTHILTSVTSAL